MGELLELDLIINAANSAKTVGELKQSLKDVNDALGKTQVGSDQYNKLAVAAGKVKAELMDMKQTIKALDPDASFGIISKSIGGIASGFQAATAAAALFGSESQELQKSLLKVQAAMALANAVKDLQEFKDTFSQLNIIIKANPILFIVGAITAIAAALPSVISYFSDAAAEAADLKEQSEEIKRITDLQVNALDNQIKILRAQKKTDAEIKDVLLLQVDAKIRAAKAALAAAEATLKQKSGEDSLYEILLKTSILIANITGNQERQASLEKELADNRKERLSEFVDAVNKARMELDNLTTERQIIEINADNIVHDNWKKIQEEKKKKQEEDAAQHIKDLQDQFKAEQDELKWQQEQIDKVDAEEKQKRLDEEKIFIEEQNKLLQQNLENEKAYNTARVALRDAYIGAVQQGFQILQGFASRNKNLQNVFFAIEKAVAAANVFINMRREIAGIYAKYSLVPGGQGIAAAEATVARIRGFTSIASILATTIQKFTNGAGGASGGGGGATGGGGGGGSNIQAPTVNPVTNASTLLNPDGTVKTENQPQDQRVYVLETDITRVQKRINTIENKAKIE